MQLKFMRICKMNKYRLLAIVLVVIGFFSGAVRGALAVTCNNGVGDYCMGTRTIQWWDGCRGVDPDGDGEDNWCEQKYTSAKTMTCDAACEYSVPDYGVCTDSTPSNGCTDTVWQYKEGTCCFNQGGGGGGCETTPPTNLAINRDYSAAKVQATWTPGTGGTKQALGASSDYMAVRFNCTGAYAPLCIIREVNLPNSQTAYKALKSLFTEAGTVYFWKIINAAGECSGSTLKPWLSSCSLTPGSSTLDIGGTVKLTMNIVDSPFIKKVTFSSNNAAVTVDPAVDDGTVANGETFKTTATGVSGGTATITARAILFDELIGGKYGQWEDCRDSATVTVNGIAD